MNKKTELAIDLGQTIYTNTINSLTQQRDELLAALEAIVEYWGDPIPIDADARTVARMSAETREALRSIAKDAIAGITDKTYNV